MAKCRCPNAVRCLTAISAPLRPSIRIELTFGASLAFENDERQAAALRRGDQFDIHAMAKNEAVDQGFADAGNAHFIRAVDQA